MADDREIEKEPPCITCMQEAKLKFMLGQRVMVKDGVKTEGGKVVPILNGPYTVVEQTSPVKFKLRKNPKGRHKPEREVHEDRIRPIANKKNDALDSRVVLGSRSSTDIEEVTTITKQFLGDKEIFIDREEVRILRRLSRMIQNDFSADIANMIQNRNTDITPEDFLKILAQEMMKDGKSNWGRIAVVMALAQKLSIDCENNEELTNSLVDVIATNIPEGGWPYFTKNFKEEPERNEWQRVVKQLIATSGIVVGLWAIFMMLSCT